MPGGVKSGREGKRMILAKIYIMPKIYIIFEKMYSNHRAMDSPAPAPVSSGSAAPGFRIVNPSMLLQLFYSALLMH